MIEVIQKPSVRKADKPDVVMARMDYVIICRVIALLNERGMTDGELSFLLGKANNYVFGFIVKPSDKNRFTEATCKGTRIIWQKKKAPKGSTIGRSSFLLFTIERLVFDIVHSEIRIIR